jgi:hypothetical protein
VRVPFCPTSTTNFLGSGAVNPATEETETARARTTHERKDMIELPGNLRRELRAKVEFMFRDEGDAMRKTVVSSDAATSLSGEA